MTTDPISTYSLLAAGFVIGITHAFDADHIAVISAVITRSKNLKHTLLVGARWGMGHTLAILVVGILIMLFKVEFPPLLESISEGLVGIMLIFIGARLLLKLRIEKWHMHDHRHDDGTQHIHLHEHKKSKVHTHKHKPMFIGLLHGIAGSAAITLLILATIDNVTTGIIYILLFGVGSMLGMVLVSIALSLPFIYLSKQKKILKRIRMFTGIIGVVIGAQLLIETILHTI